MTVSIGGSSRDRFGIGKRRCGIESAAIEG